jgi:hypothetical protein
MPSAAMTKETSIFTSTLLSSPHLRRLDRPPIV